MLDLAQLRNQLIQRYPEGWVRHHLESFPAAYFAAFDEADVDRHLGLMLDLTDDRPVAVQVRPAEGEWWVDVVGYDAFQLLSTLCCLLAVRGLSIVEGRVFTSQPPPRVSAHPARKAWGTRQGRTFGPSAGGPDRRPKVVDVLRVCRVDGAAEAMDWEGFRAELTTLARLLRADQFDPVHHALIGRMVAALDRYRPAIEGLEPIDLTIDPEGTGAATVVRIGARDSLGFLYLTTGALALFGVPIVQADIRTSGGRVDDTLWVTDRAGRTITVEARLRELRLSLILIEHFSSRLSRATDPEAALLHFSQFAADTMARPDWAQGFAALDRPEVLDALARVLGESNFLWEDYLHARPETFLPMVCDPAEWERRRGQVELAAELDATLAVAPTPEEQCRALQQFRDREIFRADVRAILGRSGGLEQFSAELTDLAEVLLEATYRVAAAETSPRAVSALFALGKCGGRELGFASDLELMLVYDDRGPAGGPGTAGAAADFDRFVAALRVALAGRRGGTFEVDLRLRPYGRGGPLAVALSAFDRYYRPGGPAWGYERQALIKLRAVAGDPALGREVEALRDRYVYGSEPFDLAGLRRMRRLQVEQLVRPGTVNAKFSPGALVDVEYTVQALQIAHGGRDPGLRTPNTLEAVTALAAAGCLAPDRAEVLRAGYRFFRALIDALRVVRGHSGDLTVPAADSEEFARLARRVRSVSPAALRAEIDARLRSTRELTDRLGELLGDPAT